MARDVFDEIWDLIESVSEGFPSYSYQFVCMCVSFPFWFRGWDVGFDCIDFWSSPFYLLCISELLQICCMAAIKVSPYIHLMFFSYYSHQGWFAITF